MKKQPNVFQQAQQEVKAEMGELSMEIHTEFADPEKAKGDRIFNRLMKRVGLGAIEPEEE